MEKDGARTDLDGTVNEFLTYDEYLDSKITPLDLYYLEDEKLARQVVELGLRGTGEVWKREEFESRKAAAQASRLSKRSEQKTLASAGKELKDNFLRALAEREEANRSGKNHSIIFIRDHSACGQEISGYIDYAHRLKCEDFEPYFSGKKRLLPRPTDLSFYNWKTNEVTSSDSANYQVIANNPNGVLFMNKKDRNIVNVDPQASPCEHSPRMHLKSDIYLHVAIFDHFIKCTI
ncbi:cilia- and flagella-associated protein 299 [Pangasianodon hypophthalmus]|uniref:cilia- and flagella-associated protein 299 n=1 Tax=Pangasianodon hypophthalmus TaxID=310915 RepID=UPI000EFF5A28|nr:cilia- and flagella-associated protein 299 [Pangasianodon hypophthalmus]